MPAARPRTDAGDAPCRRLRRKTTVGHLALGLAVVGLAAGAVGAEAPAPAPPPAPPLAPASASEWQDAFLASEDLEKENAQKRKAVYLVTLPHPKVAYGSAGSAELKAPGDYSREQVLEMFKAIFAAPEHVDAASASRGGPTTALVRCVVFREMHQPGEDGVARPHFHVAVAASQTFRFMAYKRALRARYGLASHWSCTHDGYWSAVRYGFMPTPKKPDEALDKEAVAWCRDGDHPPLFESSQQPTTAAALQRKREHVAKAASGAGKEEPRATELDLYPIIVRNGFRNTADAPWADKQLIQYLKTYGTPALVQLAFRIRHKLPALIDDVWSWETVGETLSWLGQSRLDCFVAASRGACVCQGIWRQWAEWVMSANGIDPTLLCGAVWRALRDGRCEHLPVIVLMGRRGGEGKSFFFAPLRVIFGKEFVQSTPQPGSFPLLDIETKRIALLDEWTFNETTVPLSTQLLWFEGKPFPVSRPQNNCAGHLLYAGTAPVFVTCKQKDLAPIMEKAQIAMATDQASEYTMLRRRLQVFGFCQKMPAQPGIHIPECGACFARMIMERSGQAMA